MKKTSLAKNLIEVMSADNNTVFQPSQENWDKLTQVCSALLKEGFDPTQDNIDLIAEGDQDEAEEKFGQYPHTKLSTKL